MGPGPGRALTLDFGQKRQGCAGTPVLARAHSPALSLSLSSVSLTSLFHTPHLFCSLFSSWQGREAASLLFLPLGLLLPSTLKTAADSVAILFSGVCPGHSPHGPPPCLAWPVFSVSGAGMPCLCAVPSSHLEKSQAVVEDFPPQRLA